MPLESTWIPYGRASLVGVSTSVTSPVPGIRRPSMLLCWSVKNIVPLGSKIAECGSRAAASGPRPRAPRARRSGGPGGASGGGVKDRGRGGGGGGGGGRGGGRRGRRVRFRRRGGGWRRPPLRGLCRGPRVGPGGRGVGAG